MHNKAMQQQAVNVYEVTHLIETCLKHDPQLQNIIVTGEITQYNKHVSGHIYFTLSDKEDTINVRSVPKKSIIECTFFRHANPNLTFEPKRGDEVEIFGSIAIYYQGGKYKFNVQRMRKIGTGDLLLKIQELKKKLIEQGIIDPSTRRRLPMLPKKIGIITGMDSAALKDILKQIIERYPNVDILLINTLVQGALASEQIVEAIHTLNENKYHCDIILLCRGGGSTEDLMPFNEENVVMGIFNSRIPIVSGVGHQVDHPLCDDVADLATATPTDAAKQAMPNTKELYNVLSTIGHRLDNALRNYLEHTNEKISYITGKFFLDLPEMLLNEYHQKLDSLENLLENAYGNFMVYSTNQLQLTEHIHLLYKQTLHATKIRFTHIASQLNTFSPLSTLQRGYSIVSQKDKIISSIKELDIEHTLIVQLSDGKIKTKPRSIIS